MELPDLNQLGQRLEARHHADRRELREMIAELLGIIEGLVDAIEAIEEHGHHEPVRVPVAIRTYVEFNEENPMSNVSLTDAEQVRLHIQEVDLAGNPISLEEGVASWTVDGDTIVSQTPDADPFSTLVRPLGPLGTAIVTPSVQLPDTTDDAGVTTPGALLQGTPVSITVNAAGTPAALNVTADPPEPLTPA